MRLASFTRAQVAEHQGDHAFWHAIFNAEDTCFLCDEPVGEQRIVSLWQNPRNAGLYDATAMCAACFALPAEVRRQKELRMLRAMWPGAKWRPNKGSNKEYLRGRR